MPISVVLEHSQDLKPRAQKFEVLAESGDSQIRGVLQRMQKSWYVYNF